MEMMLYYCFYLMAQFDEQCSIIPIKLPPPPPIIIIPKLPGTTFMEQLLRKLQSHKWGRTEVWRKGEKLETAVSTEVR